MSIQLGTANSYIPVQIQPNIMPVLPQPNTGTDYENLLTPEQKNTLQHNVDDKVAEQIENVKSNFQTAKDIDLMQSYYQQQQKLFDIYTQEGSKAESENSNINAVLSLTNTYAELYELHQNIKGSRHFLPSNEFNSAETIVAANINTIGNSFPNKQLDAYNSLMMPSTSSYVHLSA